MISDARGGHVSPGVYTEERDVTYAAKTLGITSLGLAGETVKGPAFQPILISDWAEFVDYFGGTSPEQFKGTGYPKYELPYIAKSYLQESKRLYVSRALGLSGYDAGKEFVVGLKVGGETIWGYSGPTTETKTIDQDAEEDFAFIQTNKGTNDSAIFERFDSHKSDSNYDLNGQNHTGSGTNPPANVEPHAYTYGTVSNQKTNTETNKKYYNVTYNIYTRGQFPKEYPVVVFRSKGEYRFEGKGSNNCEEQSYEIFHPYVTAFITLFVRLPEKKQHILLLTLQQPQTMM